MKAMQQDCNGASCQSLKSPWLNKALNILSTGLLFTNVYVTLWVSGLHDTQSRFVLWVSLMGLLIIQDLSVAMVCHVHGASAYASFAAMSFVGRVRYLVTTLALMLLIGLVLRIMT